MKKANFNKIKDRTFLSSKAAALVGVSQRTVQAWTEPPMGLIICPTKGKGHRRQYSVINCVEMAIIKKLVDGRVGLKTIKRVMDIFQDPLLKAETEELVVWDYVYLIIREIPGVEQPNIIINSLFQQEAKVEKDWFKQTSPFKIEMVLIYNLSQIAQRILESIAKEA